MSNGWCRRAIPSSSISPSCAWRRIRLSWRYLHLFRSRERDSRAVGPDGEVGRGTGSSLIRPLHLGTAGTSGANGGNGGNAATKTAGNGTSAATTAANGAAPTAATTSAAQTATEPATKRRVLAAPAVRKLAFELGVDLEQVPSSHPSGRVTLEDVRSYGEHATAAPAAPTTPATPTTPDTTTPAPVPIPTAASRSCATRKWTEGRDTTGTCYVSACSRCPGRAAGDDGPAQAYR